MNGRCLVWVCLAAMLLPALAGAWEVKVAEADRRIQEVQGGWKDSQGEPVLKSILRYRGGVRKPGWARKVRRASDKVAWSQSYGGKTYYFGVGLVEKVREPDLRISAAQDRARASLAYLLGRKKEAGAEGLVAGAIPIDWYAGRGYALYALLVVVR